MTEEMRSVRSVRTDRPGDLPVHPIVLDTVTYGLGMSKREHFAVLLLAALLSNPVASEGSTEELLNASVSLSDRLVAKLGEADRGDA